MKLVWRPKSVPHLLIGDAVTLNSGGPVMTVWDIDETGRIFCCWLVGHAMHKADFPPICLTPVERQ